MSSESSNQKDELLSFEFTKTLNHIIERVWYVLRDASISTALFPNESCPLIVQPGNNTWTVNNEFYGQVSSFGDFVGKCLKVKNFPQMKKIRKAFTLVEVICVLTIIAIIAAIAVPNISGYIEKSKINNCRSIMTDFVNDLEYKIVSKRYYDINELNDELVEYVKNSTHTGYIGTGITRV